MTSLRRALLACSLLGLGVHAASPLPEQLDAYGVLRSDGRELSVQGNTLVYSLASPLFTDYALKFRTITVPPGSKVGYRADGVLDFPVGTVISKTFFYAKDPQKVGGWVKAAAPGGERIDLAKYQLVETRILQRDTDGNWLANAYVWNEAQTAATLRRIGQSVPATLRDPATGQTQTFSYGVPNARQCQTCHAVNATVGQAGIQPIGPTARYLNASYAYSDGPRNQLERLAQIATLEGLPGNVVEVPRNVAYANAQGAPLEQRARAYLEINCAHCHHALGDARQSGLFTTLQSSGSTLGLCKQHVAAGSGGANMTYDIVPGKPQQSLLVHRMEATSGQAMMPRVGRSLVDVEGVALVREWISSLSGSCATH
ncbi:SO2930 family diheme c-type cytochrome [Curvibacter sp. APW13]|uniref:SO2930 family diheme c-type cytochrome n=1 Tax=Curvibacter sp. APW13 TaxID=3077236 RepID=UPI0028DF5392|nr:SO2930 family diheme c-type cytochrome [Curvibacter sp. APW13]MDT8991203.1 SO2930 family diheme c-type cytochrome [Curvibacter sp. APW13]